LCEEFDLELPKDRKQRRNFEEAQAPEEEQKGRRELNKMNLL
jgi:hypothetical protein